jgi:uncharacterized protein (TIRG00374 family)
LQLLKSKKGKIIATILRIAVAGGALYWAFHKVDLREVSEKLFSLNIFIVFLAVLTWLANQFIFVSRWLLLLRVQSIKIKFWAAFRLHFLGIFYNNCLPSAVGGDFIRAAYVTTHTDKKVEAALSVFVDRFVGITSMILMALVCYSFVPEGQHTGAIPEEEKKQGLISLLVSYWWIFAIILGIFLLIVIVLSINPKGRKLLKNGFGLFWHKGIVILKRSYHAMMIYWNHKIAFVFAYLLSFACQGILITGLWLVGRNLGIECSAGYYFVFFPIAWMAGAIPITVGGLGVWENILQELFKRVVIQEEALLVKQLASVSALAVFHRVLWLFGSLPGVIIHLCGAHLPKDISIDYGDGDS